ncbi:MAG TPA: hypothetical protein VFH08_08225 [Chitinophagaceae bacterium]|nr:hypothetical protein [Chitinophagaceae bacterium]
MRLFILLVAVAIFSCKQPSKTAAAEFDTAKIQTEVQALISQIRDAALHADSTSLYELFALNDPDFAYMEITGVYYDATAFKKMVYDFYGAIKTEILKKGTEKFVYLNENNVLWSSSIGITVDYKDGKREIYEPFGITTLLRKIGNKWKIVFIQESTQAPQVTTQ